MIAECAKCKVGVILHLPDLPCSLAPARPLSTELVQDVQTSSGVAWQVVQLRIEEFRSRVAAAAGCPAPVMRKTRPEFDIIAAVEFFDGESGARWSYEPSVQIGG